MRQLPADGRGIPGWKEWREPDGTVRLHQAERQSAATGGLLLVFALFWLGMVGSFASFIFVREPPLGFLVVSVVFIAVFALVGLGILWAALWLLIGRQTLRARRGWLESRWSVLGLGKAQELRQGELLVSRVGELPGRSRARARVRRGANDWAVWARQSRGSALVLYEGTAWVENAETLGQRLAEVTGWPLTVSEEAPQELESHVSPHDLPSSLPIQSGKLRLRDEEGRLVLEDTTPRGAHLAAAAGQTLMLAAFYWLFARAAWTFVEREIDASGRVTTFDNFDFPFSLFPWLFALISVAFSAGLILSIVRSLIRGARGSETLLLDRGAAEIRRNGHRAAELRDLNAIGVRQLSRSHGDRGHTTLTYRVELQVGRRRWSVGAEADHQGLAEAMAEALAAYTGVPVRRTEGAVPSVSMGASSD